MSVPGLVQDTEFLGVGRGRAKGLAGDQTEGFQVYEDTNFLSLPEGSRPGSGGNVSTPYPAAVEDRENCAPGVMLNSLIICISHD